MRIQRQLKVFGLGAIDSYWGYWEPLVAIWAPIQAPNLFSISFMSILTQELYQSPGAGQLEYIVAESSLGSFTIEEEVVGEILLTRQVAL